MPMLLPAPDRFSMKTCWPHMAESLSATVRATISVGPPAATGTTMRTGLAGYAVFGACARPSRTKRFGATAWAAASAIKRRRVNMSATSALSTGPSYLRSAAISTAELHRNFLRGAIELPPSGALRLAIGSGLELTQRRGTPAAHGNRDDARPV